MQATTLRVSGTITKGAKQREGWVKVMGYVVVSQHRASTRGFQIKSCGAIFHPSLQSKVKDSAVLAPKAAAHI